MKICVPSRICAALLMVLAMSLAANQAFADDPDFDRLIAAPDDPNANLAYAQEEAQNGNLLYAAAALERILLEHPNAHSVRLFYAVVLYRLDDLQGAKYQLEQLKGVQLTPLQEAERDKYLDLVEHGRDAFTITGKASAGVDVESDAIGALLNQLDVFFPRPVKKNGASVVTSGDLNLGYAFGPNDDYSLYLSPSIYSRTTFAGPNADYGVGELRTGIGWSDLNSSWQAGGVVRHYMVFDNPYLTEYGAQGQFSWQPTPYGTIVGTLEVVGQDYHEPAIDFLSHFLLHGTHDGVRYNASIGGAYRFDAFSTLGLSIGYEGDTAGYTPFSYDSLFVSGNFHSLLGRGAYLDLTGDVSYFNYRARDFVFLFGRRREDVRSDARVALGAPMSAFSEEGATGDFRENLIIEGAVSFADRTTKLPLAPFDSVGGQLRLVWKFGE